MKFSFITEMHTVLVLQNLEPFSSAYFATLLRHNCSSCFSLETIFLEEQVFEKSSTKRDFSKLDGITSAILLIFK